MLRNRSQKYVVHKESCPRPRKRKNPALASIAFAGVQEDGSCREVGSHRPRNAAPRLPAAQKRQ